VDRPRPTDWDVASEAFLKIAAFYDPYEEPVNDRLISLAEIEAGHTVVDIATGIGDPALSVARRVGPAGRVIATDQSESMLAIAQTRALERGLTNLEFRQLDANAYELPDETIDAIVCRWGLMFLSDLPDALSRMRRSLKRGRCLAAATWSDPGKVPIISIRRSVILAFDLPLSSNDPFRLSSPETLNSAAASGGFDEIAVTRFIVPYQYPSVDAFVAMQRMGHESRMTSLLARPKVEQDAFWRALGTAAGPYTGSDGIVRTPCEILLLKARK
jgi:ubiquinone/menaquinone biosynthesis C-methylase UbiE